MSSSNAKKSDIRRQNLDLCNALTERLDLLLSHAAGFDGGSLHFAKAIAVDLRVLLLDSLLAKLRLLNRLAFYDSTIPYQADNIFPYHGLVTVGINVIFPAFDDGPEPIRRLISYHTWSTATAMTTYEGITFSRHRLIKDFANKEGAHEDFDLPPEYYSLTRGIGLGYHWTNAGLQLSFRPDGTPVDLPEKERGRLLPNPVPPALRQLAHEVLVTIALAHPEVFPRPEIVPTITAHHPAPFGIRGLYMKRVTGTESREPISIIFNHPLDPNLFAQQG